MHISSNVEKIYHCGQLSEADTKSMSYIQYQIAREKYLQIKNISQTSGQTEYNYQYRQTKVSTEQTTNTIDMTSTQKLNMFPYSGYNNYLIELEKHFNLMDVFLYGANYLPNQLRIIMALQTLARITEYQEHCLTKICYDFAQQPVNAKPEVSIKIEPEVSIEMKNDADHFALELGGDELHCFYQIMSLLSHYATSCTIVVKTNGIIHITQISRDKSIYMRCKLIENMFSKFDCRTEFKIGIDVNNFCQSYAMGIPQFGKQICSLELGHWRLLVSKKHPEILQVKCLADDTRSFELPLNVPNPLPLPPITFCAMATYGASEFLKILKQIATESTDSLFQVKIKHEIIKLSSVPKRVAYYHSCKTCYHDKTESDHNQSIPTMLSVQYAIMPLLDLEEILSYTNTIDLHLKPDFPLVITIPLGTFGTLHFFVVPTISAD